MASKNTESDKSVRLKDLKKRVDLFAKERDWGQFHSPKNLSMALAVEAAELLELFQWKTEQESRKISSDPELLELVRQELADVVILVLNVCNVLDIDLASAVIEKLSKNATKYPIELSRGKAIKR